MVCGTEYFCCRLDGDYTPDLIISEAVYIQPLIGEPLYFQNMNISLAQFNDRGYEKVRLSVLRP